MAWMKLFLMLFKCGNYIPHFSLYSQFTPVTAVVKNAIFNTSFFLKVYFCLVSERVFRVKMPCLMVK